MNNDFKNGNTEIVKKSEKLIKKLKLYDKALVSELKRQCFIENNKVLSLSKILPVNYFDFICQELHYDKALRKRFRERLKYDSSLINKIECFEKLRYSKQKSILLNNAIEINSKLLKKHKIYSDTLTTHNQILTLRIVGCDNIDRSCSLETMLIQLPKHIQNYVKQNIHQFKSKHNQKARLRLDVMYQHGRLYSTQTSYTNNMTSSCWNINIQLPSYNFLAPLQFILIWQSPFPLLTDAILNYAPVFHPLDFIVAGIGYLLPTQTGFLSYSIDIYPTGQAASKLFIETYIPPPSVTDASITTVTSSVTTTEQSSQRRFPTFADLNLLAVIGQGSFGRIFLCETKRAANVHQSQSRYFALKCVLKSYIIHNNEYNQLTNERAILQLATHKHHPLIVHLIGCMQNNGYVMFLMEYVECGDLATILDKQGQFSFNQIRFYLASIVLCLEFLHQQNIMYRDMKMENILLDRYGYIKLVDFGLSKLQMSHNDTTNTLCGTLDYMAPEMLDQRINGTYGYTRSVDWWALGVLAYYMLVGTVPFYSPDENQTVDMILNQPIFTTAITDPYASSFVISLLNKNPKFRLGSRTGSMELKIHSYFTGVNFSLIYFRKLTPEFIPYLKSKDDISYFDKRFTRQMPFLSLTEDSANQPNNYNIDSDLFFKEFCS